MTNDVRESLVEALHRTTCWLIGHRWKYEFGWIGDMCQRCGRQA